MIKLRNTIMLNNIDAKCQRIRRSRILQQSTKFGINWSKYWTHLYTKSKKNEYEASIQESSRHQDKTHGN